MFEFEIMIGAIITNRVVQIIVDSAPLDHSPQALKRPWGALQRQERAFLRIVVVALNVAWKTECFKTG